MSSTGTPDDHPPEPSARHGFQQRLGLFDSTMLVAGSMIGSGIFIVSAGIARDVGSSGWLLVVWVLTGIMTVIGALSYAELSAMMPHAGGQYVYLREAYGPLWGFLYGWTLFLVIQTGTIAAVGVAFAKFLGVLVPQLGTSTDAGALSLNLLGLQISAGQIVGVAVVLLLTGVNCLGIQEGKWVQNLFTVAKTLVLVALIVVGLTVTVSASVAGANFQDLWTGIYRTPSFEKFHADVPSAGLVALMVMGGAMVGSLFSADAWNNVTFTAGEVKNPRRNLPLSLVMGTGMVIVLYLLANVAYLVSLPIKGTPELEPQFRALDKRIAQLEDLKDEARLREAKEEKKQLILAAGIAHAVDDRVGTAVMELASPGWGTMLMAVAIMASTFGCANGLILSGARTYYAMAQDGLFFRAVGRLNKFGVPAAGLVFQGGWAALLTFSGKYEDLLDYVVFAVLVFYALTVIGLFILRRTRPDAERPYKAFGYPVVPAIYVFLCTAVMLDLLIVKPDYTWPGLIIVLTGIPVYFLWRIKKDRPA